MSRRRKHHSVPNLTEIARRSLSRFRLAKGAVVVAGCSGGADSTALAVALAEIAAVEGWRLILAHLHHGLRGGAADADLEFVRALARRLRASFVSARVNLSERPRGVSVEMAARAARRRFLSAQARRRGAALIALGHTADDQAETVLLRLARGTSGSGLGGMAPTSELDDRPVVRPLLEVERHDIEAWLRARGQAWREDASNRGRYYLRNRVRHEVLPLIERRLNPAARRALARAARALREDEQVLADLAGRMRKRCTTLSGHLRARRLAAAPTALRRRVLRDWLRDGGIESEALDATLIERADALLTAMGGGAIALPGQWRLTRAGEELRLISSRGRSARYLARQPIPGVVTIESAGVRCEAEFDRGYARTRPPGAGRLPATAWLDRAKAQRGKLFWRPWRAGDRMHPLGMAGTKKLQDIFTDAKTPPEIRHRLPILVRGREVVWAPGYRIASGWAAADSAAPTVRIRVLPLPMAERNATV